MSAYRRPSGAGPRNPKSGFAYYARRHQPNTTADLAEIERLVRAKSERPRQQCACPKCDGPTVDGLCVRRFSWGGCRQVSASPLVVGSGP